MIDTTVAPGESLEGRIRQFIFETAAATGAVPQLPEIAGELTVPVADAAAALQRLAAARVLVLAPTDGDIWAANPFCAVPSGFRVEVDGKRYWGICAWDALGIVAALGAQEATLTAPCGDCGELLQLHVTGGQLARSESLIHFAVPAREWWKNIGHA